MKTKRTPDEQKAYRAEYMRKYDAIPENHARRLENLRKRNANPEAKSRASERARKYYSTPEVKARAAALQRQRDYGLTPEQYTIMLDSHGGVCAICKKSGGAKGLVVDHCHETGVVRGLLCVKCNTGIGLLCDDPARLTAAAKYIRDSRKRQQLFLLE
jgi:hypothetical protein